jgi:hypothetical protein
MFKNTRIALAATIGLAAITLAATTAHADINLRNAGSPLSVVQDGGVWKYTYGVFVDADQEVRNNSFFTFYDFDGYIANSVVVNSAYSWTVIEEATSTGGFAGGVAGEVTDGDEENPTTADRNNLTNIRFVYKPGPAIISGESNLGTFTFSSLLGPGQAAGGPQTVRAFAGRGFLKNTNPVRGNINATTYVIAAIPEPSEYAFMAFAGASLCGLVVRARRRKAVVAA